MKTEILNWQAAEIKSVYNSKHKADVKITCSGDIFKYIKNIFDNQEQHVEQFNVFYLNQANIIIGWKHIGMGGVTGVVADVRVIMKHAIDIMATGIILSHNHPSQNKKASPQDINLTNKVKEAAKLFDMAVLDHLIVCGDEYLSMADESLM